MKKAQVTFLRRLSWVVKQALFNGVSTKRIFHYRIVSRTVTLNVLFSIKLLQGGMH